MREFYDRFYAAIEKSAAHATFCEQVFGQNLGQHGFADIAQLEAVICGLGITPNQRILDLGCGQGQISEFLSDCTGAHVTGLDYVDSAIEQAQHRTAAKRDRLTFVVGDINALELPHAAYQAIISIDTIYFSDNYRATIRQLADALKPGGHMAILYSYGREPWIEKDKFPAATLSPSRTPLAKALAVEGLCFETSNFTEADYRLAQRRKQVLTSLRSQFEAEGNLFIYENRMGDAEGVSQAIEDGLHVRYLYLAYT